MVKREPVSDDEQQQDDTDEDSDSEDGSSDDMAVLSGRGHAASRAGPSNRKANVPTTNTSTTPRPNPESASTRSQRGKQQSSGSSKKKKAVVESSDEDESTSEDEVVVSRLVKREPQEAGTLQADHSVDTSREGLTADGSDANGDSDSEESSADHATTIRRQGRPPVKLEPAYAEGSDDDEDGAAVNAIATARSNPAKSAPAAQTPQDTSSNSSRASTPAPGTPHTMPADEPQIITEEQTDDAPTNSAVTQVLPKVDTLSALAEQGPKKRLVIHKIVLVDFKSYAGRQEIGPFHKVSLR